MEEQNRHELIEKVYNDNLSNIDELMENHAFPKSMFSIYGKIRQIDSVRSILNNINENFFTSQVLSRTLFELYLVGYYMYFKTKVEENDLIGATYYNEYFQSELIKRANYSLQLDNIKSNTNNKDISSYLEIYGEFYKNLTPSEIQEIHLKASQFNNIKKIIAYLSKANSKIAEENILHHKFFDFLEKYNELSSFVHGGVSSEVRTFNIENENERKMVINENKDWANALSSSLKALFLLILFKDDTNELIKLTSFIN